MTIYADLHADIEADFDELAAEVTFSPGARAYNAATDTLGGFYGLAVSGSALSVKGDTEQYIRLGLIESRTLTLLFRPNEFGAKPSLGSVVTWSGDEYNVEDVQPVGPDGNAIIVRVVVTR